MNNDIDDNDIDDIDDIVFKIQQVFKMIWWTTILK